MEKIPNMETDQQDFMDVCGQRRYSLLETLKALNTRDQKFLSELAMNMGLITEEFEHELKVHWFENIASPVPAVVLGTPAEEVERHNIQAIVDLTDDCIDLIYVTISFLNRMGVPVQECWDEVQRSNMAKATPCQNCGGSGNENSVSGCIECNGIGYKVVKRPDGKILKPEGWTPPNLRAIIMKHLRKQYQDEQTGIDKGG